MPQVSVIIPNYNHAKFLNNRIESIINQTCQDFEIIILDDCSTDNSREIIEKYRGNKKVSHIVYNDGNSSSTFRQWYKGINLCRGDFIWIAESDDLADEKFLQETVKYLVSNNDVGLVFTTFCRINHSGKVLYSNKEYYKGKIDSYKIQDGIDFIRKTMILGNDIPNASSVVFRKSLLDGIDCQLLFSFRYIGDWFIWTYILSKSNFIYIDMDLNYFREHEENVSGNAEKLGLDYLESTEMYKYLLNNKIIGIKEKRKIRRFRANTLINILLYNTRGYNFLMFKKIAYNFFEFDKYIIIPFTYVPILKTVRKIKSVLTNNTRATL